MCVRARLVASIVAVLVAIQGQGVSADDDFNSFMSSLSFNWQNQFSDLRYQVDQLKKNDPEKYQQLASSLGLKPGASINVPSLFNAKWASGFVSAAGLYTPPEHPAAEDTFDPESATPTATTKGPKPTKAPATSDKHKKTDDAASATADDMDNVETSESRKHKSTKSKARSTSAKDDENALDDVDHSTYVQNGNPIVGDISNLHAPIKPTGQAYSGATLKATTASAYIALPLALWALL
ncbi:hypothetical protein GGI12_000655 [Dipsacomyces acuminosporus]|nr:hypothetical protein GGI12_000655 [Dipsacomyces acuminosporus]